MKDIETWSPLEEASTQGYIEAFQSVFTEYLKQKPEDQRKGKVILDALHWVSTYILYLPYIRDDSKQIIEGVVSFFHQQVPDEFLNWLKGLEQQIRDFIPIAPGLRSMIREARIQGILPLPPET